MNKVIHLISDLHLQEAQPKLYDLLERYMVEIAPKSDQLYVLGDLFELWVGDDHYTPFNEKVINLFKGYTQNGGELFIGHGNRDFLIGNVFAESCGAQLLDEPYNFTWFDKSICLMHGDSLCTDDVAYMQLRQMVRSPQWQAEFLSQPVDARLAFAASLREQSKSAMQEKAAEIMDVNQQAVLDAAKSNHCDWLIHGHTHRPDTHQLKEITDQHLRIVLSDWREEGQYLALKDGEFSSHYFGTE
ncbi:UDP-2,3-diacylglucosamine diphosphatase [Aliikangiella marina]|uniref:UDP-2,3-diacylglucosamine hydrolase n=1 Tax=Aliikangiella marina TaxID=1712262 RepID=A0A545THE1_9GAMM|nr:UDP-2,3-diacylglucosamine diphosphatase [Aliikangiella marina]TQV76606.1 UDP-2,3-diacylglucosamine diphosphatase [Aliikangiella marina]